MPIFTYFTRINNDRIIYSRIVLQQRNYTSRHKLQNLYLQQQQQFSKKMIWNDSEISWNWPFPSPNFVLLHNKRHAHTHTHSTPLGPTLHLHFSHSPIRAARMRTIRTNNTQPPNWSASHAKKCTQTPSMTCIGSWCNGLAVAAFSPVGRGVQRSVAFCFGSHSLGFFSTCIQLFGNMVFLNSATSAIISWFAKCTDAYGMDANHDSSSSSPSFSFIYTIFTSFTRLWNSFSIALFDNEPLFLAVWSL